MLEGTESMSYFFLHFFGFVFSERIYKYSKYFLSPRLKMTFFSELVHYNSKKTEKSGIYEAECFTTGKA